MANEYVTVATLKAEMGITVTTYDTVLASKISAASRGIDQACNRRFWADAQATSVRVYSPLAAGWLEIDDLVTLSMLKVDRSASGTFDETWTNNTDFVLEPLNAAAEVPARPYTAVRVRSRSGRAFPVGYEAAVQVTGKFGWAAVPDEIVDATRILAQKLYKRQESPLGVISVGVDEATAMRIASSDPDVKFLIHPYVRLPV